MRSSLSTVVMAGMLLGLAGGCSKTGGQSAVPPTLSISAPAQAPIADAQKVGQLLEAGEWSEALDVADRAVAAHTDNASAFEARAAVYHKRQDFDRALADLNRAVELAPQNARLYNNRGFLKLSRQEFEAALADFDQATLLDPKYANAFNNRGLLHITQGRYRQAIVDLDQALKLDPNYTDARNNRGFALMQLGRWDRALADFNTTLAVNSKAVNTLANRGFVKLSLGDSAGAIVDFTAAMLLDPDNPKYYQHRREAYLLDGAVEQAQKDAITIERLTAMQQYHAAVQRRPSDPNAYLARGQQYRKTGDVVRALADITRARDLAPGRTDVRLVLAQTLFERNDFAAAIVECDFVLAAEPHQQAYSIRGDCRREQGLLEGALNDYEAAKRLDTRVAEAYFLRGEELSRQGDEQTAERLQARAHELDPTVRDRLVRK